MTLPYNDEDLSSIDEYAKKILKKSLRMVCVNLPTLEYQYQGKGGLGQAVEKYYFLYEPNNKPEPDFPKVGLELKVAAIKRINNNKFVAKERLVLNIIDYKVEPYLNWETSSFWKKNKRLLLLFYLYQDSVPIYDLVFHLEGIWDYPVEDLIIIRRDWETILEKIRKGEAERISERDTLYLSACTKGTGHGRDMREQAFSGTKAKQRAFSLKKKYIDTIISKWVGLQEGELEPIVKGEYEYQGEETFEQLVIRKFDKYIGKTFIELNQTLGLDIASVAKNRFDKTTLRILGIRSHKAEEFEKAGIAIKTIRLKNNNVPKEDISFPYFKYKELANEEWEDSTIREMLDRPFFFVVYKYNEQGILVLRKVLFWRIPYDDLEKGVRSVWEKTKHQINSGYPEDLPKKSESYISHIRPHGRDSDDRNETPDGKLLVKKSFWLNGQYIRDQIAFDIKD